VCGPIQVKAVENLLTVGAFPVDGTTREFFFRRALPEIISGLHLLRAFAIRFA
jgi:hypothetical protein